MKIFQTEGGLRTIDFPFVISLLAFLMAIFMGIAFILEIWHGSPWTRCAGPMLGLLIAAMAVVAFTQRSEFQFDPYEKKVAWSRRGLLRSRQGVIPFGRIKFAVVQCTYITSTHGSGLSYRVSLVTEDGIIPLTNTYSNGQVNDDRCRQLRTTINKMLDVHLPSEDDNDIRQQALSGQKIYAMKMAKARYRLGTTEAHQLVEQLSGPKSA